MIQTRIVNSFKYAWRGIAYVFVHEQNFRLQVYVAMVVSVSAAVFGLSRSETLAVVFLILLVLILELLNSAIEKFADILKPRLDLHIGVVKDIMAAMVLLASLGAACIGLVIFWPYIVELVRETWYNMST